MLSSQELQSLLVGLETDRIERTVSQTDSDKFGEAICAFANDLPNNQKSGYLIIGANDDGSLANLIITDEFLRKLSDFGNDGRILPKPTIIVGRYELEGGQVAVVEVHPSLHPPLRFKGRVYIRTGARKAIASEAEERILIEKRTATAKTFDALPCWGSKEEDLSLSVISTTYLPMVINSEILAANHRDSTQQLASLRLFDLQHHCPTNMGILLFGVRPLYFMPGAYVQYLRIKGTERNLENIAFEKKFAGAMFDMLKELDSFVLHQICATRPVRQANSMQDKQISNYPYPVLREFVMNALMHRDYESNAPVFIYEYDDRIEIQNPGGLYGSVRPENFPNASDYRNPLVAEVFKALGYVNRFNFGIADAQKRLSDNGSSPAVFVVDEPAKFKVTVGKHGAFLSPD